MLRHSFVKFQNTKGKAEIPKDLRKGLKKKKSHIQRTGNHYWISQKQAWRLDDDGAEASNL